MYPLFFPPQLAATAPHAIAAPECFRTQVDYADTCHRYAGYGGERVFRRPRPCRYCGDAGGCECSEDASLEPGDVEVIAFQIQLYELGLDAEWIRGQVAFRGMEARERLRYEFDGTERFFTDGVPSARALPTGPATAGSLPLPLPPPPPPLPLPPFVHGAPKSPPLRQQQQQYPHPHPHPHPQQKQQQRPQQQQQHHQQASPPQRPPPLVRRESRLRYMETYEASENATVRRGGGADSNSKDEVLVMLGKMRLGDAEKAAAAAAAADLEPPASTKRTNRRRRGKNRAVYP